MELCDALIKDGMALRTAATILALTLVAKYAPPRYMLLALPVVLHVLDLLDGVPFTACEQCYFLFDYQYQDKICDLLSYALTYLFLPVDALFYLIMYRACGVTLFTLTKQSVWLIVFFDFVKEYMLYSFFFNSYIYLPLFVLGKIGFEYYWHKRKNTAVYHIEAY